MKKHSLFIAIAIGLLTASAASAQDFTVLGTVSNDSDPALFQPEQFDVSDFFPETNSATVTFDFKNDTPPLPGPGDDPNSLTFSSDLTVSEISATRLDGEFQFRFQYIEGADTNHLRDVQLNLDGEIFRDQFADFNDHLGGAALGTARMGAGLAVNALGLVGPEAQIYLIAFSLIGSILDDVLPDFSFTADDLAQLSVDFSPCDAGGCDVNTLGDFSLDNFTFDLAACDGGGCDALFEIPNVTGTPRDPEMPWEIYILGNYEPGYDPPEYTAEEPGPSLPDRQREWLDVQELRIAMELEVEMPPSGLFDSRDEWFDRDRGVDVYSALRGPGPSPGMPPNDLYNRIMSETTSTVGGAAEAPPVVPGRTPESVGSEAEAQQLSAEFARDLEQYQQDQIQRDLYEALGIQNQIDMNNDIESVIPELAGFVDL